MILNQSFFSDWKPQVWQHQFLLLKTTIWSEIASSHQHRGPHYSRQGFFFFLTCLSSQRQCKKFIYTWNSKSRATLLVLQCQSQSYHKRRWGNLASTVCLLSVPHSDLLATTSLTLQTAEGIMLAELKQSWSCVAIEHEELAIETEA